MTRALIVDDSKLARIVVKKAIASLRPDWKCVEAPNAAEAMVIVAFQAIDAVLIDYNMPDKNGLELLAEMRALHPSMPAAVITANVQREIIDRALALGATFVTKPVSAEALLAFIEKAEKKK